MRGADASIEQQNRATALEGSHLLVNQACIPPRHNPTHQAEI